MRTVRWIVAGMVAASLAACGADSIESPGQAGDITIINPPPPPTTTEPPPQGPVLATPAAACPTIADPAGLTDGGTITGPTGTYRVCALPARITANTTLERLPGVLYALNGRVDVGVDRGPTPTADAPVILTIHPGVIVFGQTGTSWLVVNRGNRIHAGGEATKPIIFTSRDNVQGLSTDDSQGQWGGVVLLGRAPVTDCRASDPPPPAPSIAGTVDCDRQTEGAVDLALFGGATPDDNSGTIKYVQIRYSGYVLSGNSELQSLTLGGVGSGTTIDYFQSHNSSDDGFENFGGRAHMRHVVITGADDDSIDLDTGYQGTLQYVIAVQKTSGAADSLIELDSANTLEYQVPRTHMKLANFTFVHRNPGTGNLAAMLFRGKADATLVNGVVTSPIACLRLAGANILTADPAEQKLGPPAFHSVSMQCGSAPFAAGTGVTAEQAAAVFNAGPNSTATFTASLTDTFVNGANEAARPATDPTTLDPAFDATNYVGAVRDASDTWYASWTCNSTTASFGTGSSACTSLPSLVD
jgi:hypothetical protein